MGFPNFLEPRSSPLDNEEKMTSQVFFWISFLIGAGLALLFLWPRSRRGPSRLRMARSFGRTPVAAEGAMSAEAKSEFDSTMKSLNVMFIYNGHSWDAHEVLGLPAGAPLHMVEEAYRKSLESLQGESSDFIDTAYQAITAEIKKK
ncbi:MAG: hypothetical protein C5B49_07150 [Bdellovibrio sp.]|nr:MAG: hypothetical protein C5B49_07150 [Bdellovibrio sp.]